MLHVATVHYQTPMWVEIQTSHLREHVSAPYQTWASLQGIDPSYSSYFDHVIDQTGRHSDKLNHLAIEIASVAAADDLLMFLDGDAFPIADPMPLISAGLSSAALVAVQRTENAGDPQPHPCFCVTTVKTWRELCGDWSQGYRWVNANGKRVSDVGGNLLRSLEVSKTPWVPVLRSNRTNLDPVYFGIYGDIIYHHGAGFRGADDLTRFHMGSAPKRMVRTRVPLFGRWLKRRDWQKRRSWDRDTRQQLTDVSEQVFAKIRRGDNDWLAQFI